MGEGVHGDHLTPLSRLSLTLTLSHTPNPCTPQDPFLEGERILHDLETMPPSQLFEQLIAVALANSVQLLGSCQGAQLPPVQDLVEKYIL
jgi:hypothetical protein